MAYTYWPKKDSEDEVVKFDFDDKSLFGIPLSQVVGCVAGKNEVSMSIRGSDDIEVPIQLSEIRILVQNPADDDIGVADPVDEFCQAVRKVIGDEQQRGPIVSLDYVSLSSPRGRYDLKLTPTTLMLHGRSFSYQVPFSSIKQFFHLPGNDQQVYIVLRIEPAIGQGNTKYPFLVMDFNKEDETAIEFQLSEEQLRENYGGKLEKKMEGPVYQLLVSILQVLVKKKAITPGGFIGATENPFISCVQRQVQGLLYPLDDGFLTVMKPPVYIPYNEIGSLNFERSVYNTRSFDFEISLKTGASKMVFSTIKKDEFSRLNNFLLEKGLNMRGNEARDAGAAGDEDDDEDADEDDDYVDDEDDVYEPSDDENDGDNKEDDVDKDATMGSEDL